VLVVMADLLSFLRFTHLGFPGHAGPGCHS
jgi:hypothetical protein